MHFQRQVDIGWVPAFCCALLTTIATSGAIFGQGPPQLLPDVGVATLPRLPEIPAWRISNQRRNEIYLLVYKELPHNATRRDLDINDDMSFVPVGEFDDDNHWTGEPMEGISDPVRALVEAGADAIPQLLKSLDSHQRTRISVESGVRNGHSTFGQAEFLAFDTVVSGNPAALREARILGLSPRGVSPSSRGAEGSFVSDEIGRYDVKTGDLCFVILGHILGRSYICAQSMHPKVPDSYFICSAARDRLLRERIQKVWGSENPRQTLFESLCLDFSTRGVLPNGESLDLGSVFQANAAKRLLFYYPKLGPPIVTARLNNLSLSSTLYETSLINGVRLETLIHSVVWSKDEQVLAALKQLRSRLDAKGLHLGDHLQATLDRAVGP